MRPSAGCGTKSNRDERGTHPCDLGLQEKSCLDSQSPEITRLSSPEPVRASLATTAAWRAGQKRRQHLPLYYGHNTVNFIGRALTNIDIKSYLYKQMLPKEKLDSISHWRIVMI